MEFKPRSCKTSVMFFKWWHNHKTVFMVARVSGVQRRLQTYTTTPLPLLFFVFLSLTHVFLIGYLLSHPQWHIQNIFTGVAILGDQFWTACDQSKSQSKYHIALTSRHMYNNWILTLMLPFTDLFVFITRLYFFFFLTVFYCCFISTYYSFWEHLVILIQHPVTHLLEPTSGIHNHNDTCQK